MITIRINGIDYNVRLVGIDSANLVVGGTTRCGAIFYQTGDIYILETLPPPLMRQSIMHELTHAYICAYGFMRYNKFTDEQLCDFMAAYSGAIVYDAEAILKHYGIEQPKESV
jgi:hypothetical protein